MGSSGSTFGDHQLIAAFGVTEAKPPKPEGARGLVLISRYHSWKSAIYNPHPTSSSKKEITSGWGREGQPLASASSRESLLNELHIVGRKHAKVAIWPIATPPAFVNHLNAGDEVLRVKGDLGLVGCKEGEPRCCAESSGTLATSLS